LKAIERYLIVIEKGETGFSAYSPDILGCVATGKTLDQTIANMKSALAFHLRGLLADGEEMPKPRGVQSYLDAEQDSEGEEYFITHIAVKDVLPARVLA
jgi:predicted RNase H-like HicB family nuclease